MADENKKNEIEYPEYELPENILKLLLKLAILENTYYAKKNDLEFTKNKLLLETDWVETLKKNKPTVGEKEAYILTQDNVRAMEKDVSQVTVRRDYYRRLLELVMTGKILLDGYLGDFE